MNPRSQKPIWRQVADLVKEHPGGLTRADVAEDFQVTKSTAMVHLEKCVERGLIFKVYTWTSKSSRGWVYIHEFYRPGGMTIEEEIEWQNSQRS